MKAFLVSGFCFFFFILVAVSSISALTVTVSNEPHHVSAKFILGEQNLGPWKNVISDAALAPGPASDDATQSTLVLAENRTNRPDILHGLRHYHGGWDITNRHYWASVGFTGAPGFILAVLWFISFGLALAAHHCCGWRINIKGKGSHHSQRIWLILLILFTCAAAIGCILLSVGQDKFHGEVLHTLNYVVNQSDYTVGILKNVTQYLSLAKTISVAQVFLPSDVMDDIDKLNMDLNTAADTLTEKTSQNSVKIKKAINAVRSALITVAAVMLLLALIGLILSILGHKHAIHIFIISGWLLVAITFVLCGVFVILNNTVSDTCMAMEEWVEYPHAETALSNVLPCVDHRTTNQTLVQSKKIVNQILQDRQCESREVSVANASEVWKNYTCKVSASGLCTTVGRVTPDIYAQLVAAVNESYALEHYTPPLLSLQDCNFVRDTFKNITASYCPPLSHYLKIVNAGLGMISVGVLLCLVLWILYANRPQREEVFVTLPIKGSMSYKNCFCNNSIKNDVPISNHPSGEV
ncbi:hypothetical protein CMV_017804 [Castanea mollissima]|uniref:Uncharacterized protein n=1 Tax=Castanea mollissima TaxID=60419 RepID=A0A8J4VIB1_9ROSI|nr:hypothetical protein CMV_017804 [Castanea mollissima]